MTTTANLGITLLESGQLQPDVTVNDGFGTIDAAWGETIPTLSTKLIAINAQTGTTYTITATDLGKLLTFDNSAAITVMVPAESSEALPNGFSCLLAWIGEGQVTLEEEDSNVVILSPETLSLRTKGAQAALVKISGNTWLLEGNLEPL